MEASNHFLKVILYEGEGAVPLPVQERFTTLQILLENGYEVLSTRRSTFCEIDENSSYLILGKFAHGVPQRLQQSSGGISFYFENLDDLTSSELSAVLNRIREQVHGAQPGQWKPWFPVIDYDRCTNCLQCLSFCLFDVYGMDAEKRIQVQNPTKCKTDCPACSRVCPEVAIIFPKYKHGPINGDEVKTEDIQREKMKVDISSLLGGDIYHSLRERREKAKSRFSKERDEERALKERMRCLSKLKQDLDIPDEVLMSLPSLEEIQAKASRTSK
ncbi:MAG: ferredoxin family protein [bacterium]|jgi:NAD-dependent dihydropyrimidine dehydrogenase PreA subunit